VPQNFCGFAVYEDLRKLTYFAEVQMDVDPIPQRLF
jgi:hypothetical protein